MTIAPLSIHLLSNTDDLQPVREALRDWMGRQEWTHDQISEVVLAVDEALTNVIRHGYDGQPDQPIHFHAARIEEPKAGVGLEITVRDFGKQVELSKICGRDLNDIRPGGLGVHLIHAMMSAAHYEHARDGGMRLTMRKYLTHTAEVRE